MSERLPGTTIECFDHTQVQGEPIDTLCLPFSEQWLRGNIPVVLSVETASEEPTTILKQTSPNHARSFEVDMNPNAPCLGVWHDQYDNTYTSLSTKGNNFSQSGVMFSRTAPSGIIPFGLQEDEVLLRVLRASRMMREANIDTEWIVRLAEPKVVKYGDVYVPQDEYKRQTNQEMIARFSENIKPGEPGFDEEFEMLQKYTGSIDAMNFFITVRASKISDRVADFLTDKSKEAILDRLTKVFEVYNLTNDGQPLDSKNQADIDRYFTEILPANLALNLAKLHSIGLAHRFPYTGNISALGGLVDTDSVSGQPLGFGDDEIGFQNVARDICFAITRLEGDNFDDVFNYVQNHGVTLPEKAYEQFVTTFLTTYLDNVVYDKDPQEDELQKITLLSSLIDENFTPPISVYETRVRKYFDKELNTIVERFNIDERQFWEIVADYSVDDLAKIVYAEFCSQRIFGQDALNQALQVCIEKSLSEKNAKTKIGSYFWSYYEYEFFESNANEDIAKKCMELGIEEGDATIDLMSAVTIVANELVAQNHPINKDLLRKGLQKAFEEYVLPGVEVNGFPSELQGSVTSFLMQNSLSYGMNEGKLIAICPKVDIAELLNQGWDNSVPGTIEWAEGEFAKAVGDTKHRYYFEHDERLRGVIIDGTFEGFSYERVTNSVTLEDFDTVDSSYLALVIEDANTHSLSLKVAILTDLKQS